MLILPRLSSPLPEPRYEPTSMVLPYHLHNQSFLRQQTTGLGSMSTSSTGDGPSVKASGDSMVATTSASSTTPTSPCVLLVKTTIYTIPCGAIMSMSSTT